MHVLKLTVFVVH